MKLIGCIFLKVLAIQAPLMVTTKPNPVSPVALSHNLGGVGLTLPQEGEVGTIQTTQMEGGEDPVTQVGGEVAPVTQVEGVGALVTQTPVLVLDTLDKT